MKISIPLRFNKTNSAFCANVIALAFFKTPLIQFLNIAFSFGSILVYATYSLLLLHMFSGVLRRGMLRTKALLIYMLLLFAFAISYLLASSTKSYYFETEMLLVYIYYLPMAIFVVPNLSNLGDVLEKIKSLRISTLIMSSVMLFFMSYSQAGSDTYMQFSYAILPFVLICFYNAYVGLKKWDYLLFALGMFECLIYGARTPLIIIIAFVVITIISELFEKRDSPFRKITVLFLFVILFIAVTLFFDDLLSWLSNFGVSTGSYAIQRLSTGNFLSSVTRDAIYENAINLIKTNNGRALGLFADRVELHIIYVHNLFLELIINFGVIIGGLISVTIIYKIITSYFRQKEAVARYSMLLMFMVVFVRFMVSGSYLTEGMSLVYFSLLLLSGKRKNVLQTNGDIRAIDTDSVGKISGKSKVKYGKEKNS